MTNETFQELIWQKARELYRAMPWREDTRPYYVLVSELMLQQTQVERVIPKFEAFIAAFPDEMALASTNLDEVLRLWQGLGYNRRAKYLHDAAKMIVSEFSGKFPDTYDDLVRLPGVGKNTAGAILAYSYNQPVTFIETNIRTVFLHHFFADNFAIDDKQILEKLTETIDHEHPREFYWSLMDYGSWLKRQGIKNISQSRHYKKQTPLKGSVREVRGQIVKTLSERTMTATQLSRAVQADERFDVALAGLIRDGLVMRTTTKLHLTK